MSHGHYFPHGRETVLRFEVGQLVIVTALSDGVEARKQGRCVLCDHVHLKSEELSLIIAIPGYRAPVGSLESWALCVLVGDKVHWVWSSDVRAA